MTAELIALPPDDVLQQALQDAPAQADLLAALLAQKGVRQHGHLAGGQFEAFGDAADTYVDNYFAHMHKEEQKVLPLAMSLKK